MAVSLPLALALGVASGASAAAGMVTAIVAGLVIGGLSGGSYQISGASGAMSVILLSIVKGHGLQGMFVASLVAGIIVLAAGLLRLGKLVSLIPLPVIVGFTSGSALIIAAGQMNNLLGLGSEGSVKAALTTGQGLNPAALALGLGVLVVIFTYPKKLEKYCPPFLAAIILATAASLLLGLPVERVGDIPRSLLLDQRLEFGQLTPAFVMQLLPFSVSIAALCYIESLLCGIAAGRMKEEPLDANQELIAQGIGNILLPLFGGVPATAAIARSSVAIKAGGQTRLTTMIHALVLLLSMFVLGGVMSVIPLPALAGVLLATSVRMNDWKSMREMFAKRQTTAIVQFLTTVLATVVFDLTTAILIGVAVALVCYLFEISRLQVSVCEVDPSRMASPYEPERHGQTRVAYLTGPLFFGTAGSLPSQLQTLEDAEHLILSMRGVLLVDISGAKALQDLCHQLSRRNIKVYLSAMQPNVAQRLEHYGVIEVLGAERVYANVNHALASIS